MLTLAELTPIVPNTTPVENISNAPICPYGVIAYHWDTHQCGTIPEIQKYVDDANAQQAASHTQFLIQKWVPIGGLLVMAYVTKSWIPVLPAAFYAVIDVEGGW